MCETAPVQNLTPVDCLRLPLYMDNCKGIHGMLLPLQVMSYCCTWMTAGEYMGCFQPCTYRYLLPRLKGTYGYMHRMFSTVHIGISFRNKRALMDTCIYDWRGIYGMCFECIPASAPRNGTSLLWVQGHLQSANSEVYFSISVNLRSVYSKHIYIYVKY